MRPYLTASEHLRDEVAWLDQVLDAAIDTFERPTRTAEFEHFGGLILGAAEVRDELAGPPGRRLAPAPDRGITVDESRAEIDRRRAVTLESGPHLPFLHLSTALDLSPFEERCLLLGLAPELDRKYERVFAYLQDDVTRKMPTLELALGLFCATPEARIEALQSMHPASSLRRLEVLLLLSVGPERSPLITRPMKVEDRVAHLLLGAAGPDSDLALWTEIDWDNKADAPPELATLTDRIDGLVARHFESASTEGLVVAVHGRYGSGRESLVRHVCRRLGLPSIWLDARKLPRGGDPARAVRRAFREGLLHPAAVCVRNFDELRRPDASSDLLRAFVSSIESLGRLTFLVGEHPWHPTGLFRQQSLVHVACPAPGYDARWDAWRDALGPTHDDEPGPSVDELASKFRFTRGQIADAVAEARAHGFDAPGVGPTDQAAILETACRNQGTPSLGEMARKIDPTFSWDDIVLPAPQFEQLREVAAHVRHARTVMSHWGFGERFPLGRAVTSLFAGGSGTGKTMAAEILAADLGLDLFAIDLSGVVSKYIGETEKNLSRIFREAKHSSAILFFDEADALFGKRSEVKDSHDRYANIEVAYLLQKMEEYDGIVVLATNLKKNLDDAFVRRMRFIIDFPHPGEADRERIWRRVFPKDAPLDPGVDFRFLARKVRLTGGNIKNISLRAAYGAAKNGRPSIEMTHLLEAAKHELDKVGILYTDEELGLATAGEQPNESDWGPVMAGASL